MSRSKTGMEREQRNDTTEPTSEPRTSDIGDRYATGRESRREFPRRSSSMRGRDRADFWNVAGVRVALRICRVQAVDVGQQHQTISLHHRGYACGEAIIIAITNFGRRHRVILVDHRNRIQR